MQGQIAGATPLSQLFIYMNNCLQFWLGLKLPWQPRAPLLRLEPPHCANADTVLLPP